MPRCRRLSSSCDDYHAIRGARALVAYEALLLSMQSKHEEESSSTSACRAKQHSQCKAAPHERARPPPLIGHRLGGGHRPGGGYTTYTQRVTCFEQSGLPLRWRLRRRPLIWVG